MCYLSSFYLHNDSTVHYLVSWPLKSKQCSSVKNCPSWHPLLCASASAVSCAYQELQVLVGPLIIVRHICRVAFQEVHAPLCKGGLRSFDAEESLSLC